MQTINNFISVIICTYNNCESLAQTLESIYKQESISDFELIVIDNNSNDMTKNIVSDFQKKLEGKLKYVFEKNQGKCYALNAGIKEAKGDILAFTDEDVTVDNHWLYNINKGFNDYGCFGLGGKILPIWEAERPPWLTRNLWHCLALLDMGDNPKNLTLSENAFYGANFAIKRQVFQEGFSFNTKLGPSPGKHIGGEDTDLFLWLLRSNKKLVYDPQVIVWHRISKERLKTSYFIKWKFNHGIACFYLAQSFKSINQNENLNIKRQKNNIRIKVKKLILLVREYFFSLIRSDNAKRFEIELNFIAKAGKAFAYFKDISMT